MREQAKKATAQDLSAVAGLEAVLGWDHGQGKGSSSSSKEALFEELSKAKFDPR